MAMRGRALVAALVLAACATGDALAQPKAPATKPASPVAIEQVLYLIRSTLLTLNDANRSGNYSVLRDLAAPDFQAKNTAADLSLSFSDLRRRNFDLFAAALIAPQLTAARARPRGQAASDRIPSDAASADQLRPHLPDGGRAMASVRRIDRDARSAAAGSGATIDGSAGCPEREDGEERTRA